MLKIGHNRGYDFSRYDLLAISSILMFAALAGAVRLSVSPNMERDEAELFLAVAHSWQNINQPPLYTFIISGLFSIFGVSSTVLIGVKYVLIFFFYSTFYLIVRKFWSARHALAITGSLLFFLVYSYDFIRHLTHTVLVSFAAALTCLVYVHLLSGRGKSSYYALLGMLAGLGILSKYSYLFFLSALVLSSLSCNSGRKVITDKKILIAFAAFVIVVAPHYVIMMRENFTTINYALSRAGAGEADILRLKNFLYIVKVCFIPYLLLGLVFMVFFHSLISHETLISHEINSPAHRLVIFRWLAFYGAIIPFITSVMLQSAYFNERWFAPVFFTFPVALFSFVKFESNKGRTSLFGYICLCAAVSVILFRAVAGFSPDLGGKVERIHIPFRELSFKLEMELRKEGVSDLHGVMISSDDWYLPANLSAWMPGSRAIPLEEAVKTASSPISGGSRNIIVWKAIESGNVPDDLRKMLPPGAEIKWLKADYLHSRKFSPYTIGVAFL
jgi:hypothetical protein